MLDSSIQHESYMRRCFDLARGGRSLVKTNPLVGSVIAQGNKILAEGYHKKFGGPHAEVHAIRGLTVRMPPGARIYVSLEPCSHYGKTPPCADLIVKNQLAECLIGTLDPNALVQGRGIQKLMEGGIKVTVGVCQSEADELLRPFRIQQHFRRPYVILKWAQSRDQFVGFNNQRTKISHPVTDRLVHKWRSLASAIMVGSNTVIIDNPALSNRLYWGESPVKVVIDRHQQIPETAAIFQNGHETLYYSRTSREFASPSVTTVLLDSDHNLLPVLHDLYQREIGSILVEGGPTLLRAFINQGLWDEARIITSPILLGKGVKSPLIEGFRYQAYQLNQDQIQYLRPHRTKIC